MAIRVFALLSLLLAGEALAGSVTGKVQGAGGGALADANVTICTLQKCLAGTQTAADGTYRFEGLAAGSYYVIAVKEPFYISQAYSGYDSCPSCEWSKGGTPVLVTADGETAGIDFSLNLGGTFSGAVRDAETGAPLRDIELTIVGAFGARFVKAYDTYSSRALPPGEYTVYTSARSSRFYLNQVYPNRHCSTGIRCNSAELAAGQKVTVVAGQDTSGIDFSLLSYRTISGTVKKSDGTPMPREDIFIEDRTESSGLGLGSRTDGSGNFVATVPPGTFVLSVQGDDGYAGTTSAPIPVGLEHVTGVDLVLRVTFANLQGTIRDRNGKPFAGVEVTLLDKYGNRGRYTTTDAAGNYSSRSCTRGAITSWPSTRCSPTSIAATSLRATSPAPHRSISPRARRRPWTCRSSRSAPRSPAARRVARRTVRP